MAFALIKPLAIAGAVLALAGCETSGAVSSQAECHIFKPMRWKRADAQRAPDLLRQAKEHNAAGKAACGW